MNLAERFAKDILQIVLGIFPVLQDLEGHPVDPVRMSADKLSEGHTISGACTGDKLFLRLYNLSVHHGSISSVRSACFGDQPSSSQGIRSERSTNNTVSAV